MHQAGTQVILIGMDNGITDGIDDPPTIKELSEDFKGIIWTDKIEAVGSIEFP